MNVNKVMYNSVVQKAQPKDFSVKTWFLNACNKIVEFLCWAKDCLFSFFVKKSDRNLYDSNRGDSEALELTSPDVEWQDHIGQLGLHDLNVADSSVLKLKPLDVELQSHFDQLDLHNSNGVDTQDIKLAQTDVELQDQSLSISNTSNGVEVEVLKLTSPDVVSQSLMVQSESTHDLDGSDIEVLKVTPYPELQFKLMPYLGLKCHLEQSFERMCLWFNPEDKEYAIANFSHCVEKTYDYYNEGFEKICELVNERHVPGITPEDKQNIKVLTPIIKGHSFVEASKLQLVDIKIFYNIFVKCMNHALQKDLKEVKQVAKMERVFLNYCEEDVMIPGDVRYLEESEKFLNLLKIFKDANTELYSKTLTADEYNGQCKDIQSALQILINRFLLQTDVSKVNEIKYGTLFFLMKKSHEVDSIVANIIDAERYGVLKLATTFKLINPKILKVIEGSSDPKDHLTEEDLKKMFLTIGIKIEADKMARISHSFFNQKVPCSIKESKNFDGSISLLKIGCDFGFINPAILKLIEKARRKHKPFARKDLEKIMRRFGVDYEKLYQIKDCMNKFVDFMLSETVGICLPLENVF